MRPKSSSSTLIWRKSIEFTVPSVISSSYVSPVRLSVTERVSCAVATPPPFSLCVCSSAIALSPLKRVLSERYLPALASEELGELRRLDRELGHLGRRDRESDAAFRRASHLGGVDEAAFARCRLYDDPVEDALAVEVEDLVDGPHPGLVGGIDGR